MNIHLYTLFIMLSVTSLNAQTGEWLKPTNDQLRQQLNHEQFTVIQNGGTETPFKNAYWNNTREGIYVDIVSGEALFSSRDKFKSGTGWPSFYKPISTKGIVEKIDWSMGFEMIEVRSQRADSHLGHVFDDGPDAKGLRYCINSASLNFIPKENLAKEGYGHFTSLFQSSISK